MSAKSKVKVRRMASIKATSAKTVSARKKHVAATTSVKTRRSLKGMTIYPASVEPSKHVQQIVAELTGQSSAA